MVGGGREIDALDEEKQSENDGSNVKERHNFHQVVVDELAGEKLGVMRQEKRGPGDGERRHSVALELRGGQTMQ